MFLIKNVIRREGPNPVGKIANKKKNNIMSMTQTKVEIKYVVMKLR